MSRYHRSLKYKIISNIKGLFIAIIIALCVRMFFIEPYKIPSESMYPNIIKGDMIMASKFKYGIFFPIVNLKIPSFIHPKSGDIALFQTPTYHSPGKFLELINFVTFGIFQLDNNDKQPKFFIKRVIGAPGASLYITQPSYTNYQSQITYNQKPLKLVPYKGKIPFKHSDDFSYFIEKGVNKNYIVQFFKPSSGGFSFPYNGFSGDVYVPKKGDQLEFSIVQSSISQEQAKRFEEKHYLPAINPKDMFRLVVNKSKEISIDSLSMNTFYYLQQVNTVLTSEDVYTLYKTGKVDISIKDDFFLMMGDNRDNSSDSRYWGFVKSKYIMGSPLFRYYPFRRFGHVNIL